MPSRRDRFTFRASTLLAAAGALALLGAGLGACSLGPEVDGAFNGPSGGATSGASSGSSSGSSSGTGGTAGAGGSSTGSEDCTNGVDDDGDGDTDCADSDCGAGFECVDAAPQDWDGYFRLQRHPYGNPAEPCPDGVDPEIVFTMPAGPAQCTACTCGGVQGAVCSPPEINCWGGSTTCFGIASNWTNQLADGMCHKPGLGGVTLALSCSIVTPSAVGQPGTCPPSVVDFPNKEPWGQQIEACGGITAGAGCAGGQVCIPRAQDPMQSVCVRQEGTAPCPAGWSTQAQGFAGENDTRACSDCQCGAASTTCSGGSYTFYDLNGCAAGGDPPIDVSSSTCVNLSSLLDQGSWGVQATPAQANGMCMPSGGQPTGSVQGNGPVTFCCR